MEGPASAIGRFVEGNPGEAAARLRAVLADEPRNAEAWRLLGRALRHLGEEDEAAEAEVSAVRATAFEPEMIAIATAMRANDLPRAEALLRQRLNDRYGLSLAGTQGRLATEMMGIVV